jgi:hypothetical protein
MIDSIVEMPPLHGVACTSARSREVPFGTKQTCQFLNVGRLNAGHMTCARLPPVPFPCAAGKDLSVLKGQMAEPSESSSIPTSLFPMASGTRADSQATRPRQSQRATFASRYFFKTSEDGLHHQPGHAILSCPDQTPLGRIGVPLSHEPDSMSELSLFRLDPENMTSAFTKVLYLRKASHS